jgi:hypothetical protein
MAAILQYDGPQETLWMRRKLKKIRFLKFKCFRLYRRFLKLVMEACCAVQKL